MFPEPNAVLGQNLRTHLRYEFLVGYAEKLASWYQKKDRCVSGENCGLVLLVLDPRHVIVSIVGLC